MWLVSATAVLEKPSCEVVTILAFEAEHPREQSSTNFFIRIPILW